MMITTSILVKEGTVNEVMMRLESVTGIIKINSASPSRLLEQAHGWIVLIATELSFTRPSSKENNFRRERLLRALDDSIVRYQRRAALLALRG